MNIKPKYKEVQILDLREGDTFVLRDDIGHLHVITQETPNQYTNAVAFSFVHLEEFQFNVRQYVYKVHADITIS